VAHQDEPKKLGWLAPALDLHGSPLYPGRMVTPDSKGGFDPKVKRVFEAHELFEVDEKNDPNLAAFVSQDHRFTTSNKRFGTNFTRAGEGI
jgi:hypothetical protein